ncbi:MAG TPA: BadF/BadG/BcrA/BcrD ATPase family protein [Bryobacteraceae bacterium]|nr:BadF/BadG/BcrA/BcrD ATPase family protein [Bryobacteraceae bacterium]
MTGELFLGVDGGQSSTTALIGDEAGQVLGAGVGGPCNHVGPAEARRKFTAAMEECVGAACAQAGLDRRTVRFAVACFGMSGGPADKEGILAEILPANRLIVTTDAVIALSGATAGEPGIITISGTGSIAFGRNAAGRTARVGGWGHIFGDEGSGFDIARQALRAALRMEEGWGADTALRGLLLAETGAADANDMLHLFYTEAWPRSRVARLATLVDQAARAADTVALELLHNAAQQLAVFTASVRRQLFQPGEPVAVAYIGGVFGSGVLLERYRQLVELEEGTRCGPPIYGPAAGALLEAYRAAGLHPALRNLPEVKA